MLENHCLNQKRSHSSAGNYDWPKSLHSALSNEAEREGVSLNTLIVALLSERHVAKKLLNKIEYIESVIDPTRSRVTPEYMRSSQPSHKIEEPHKKK